MIGELGTTEWRTVLVAVVALLGAFGGVLFNKIRELCARTLQFRKEMAALRTTVGNQGRQIAALASRHILIQQEARQRFGPIQEVLWRMGREPVSIKDSDSLARRIETATLPDGTALRDWLAKNICKPLGVNRVKCLAMAVEVAREHGEAKSA